MTLTLAFYSALMRGLHGFAPALLRNRVAKGKEDAIRYRERLGLTQLSRPNGSLVWFHGVSVGESLSALPVIERLRTELPDITVLITTATTTSADILAKRLPEGVIHQFAPIDTPQAVTAFLDHWQPSLAVFLESDIWPNLLQTLRARDVPHVLLSARITEKSFRGWQRFRRSMQQLLSGYSLVMAQDHNSEERLKAVGDDIVKLGPRANLKSIGAPLRVDADALSELKNAIGGRFVLLAASTHYGEDSILAKSLESFVRAGDLLVLAPRHPIRADEIRLDMEAIGLRVAQRIKNDSIFPETQIYLADTLGELGLFFSAADLVIMGGSFLDKIGGHNPLEPARLGKCVITGPDISNWQGIFADLLREDAAFKVQGPAELSFLVTQLRANPVAIRLTDDKAFFVSQQEADTLDIVWQSLTPLLPS